MVDTLTILAVVDLSKGPYPVEAFLRKHAPSRGVVFSGVPDDLLGAGQSMGGGRRSVGPIDRLDWAVDVGSHKEHLPLLIVRDG